LHDGFLAIDADVRLGTEMSLVAFPRLMHLRIALARASKRTTSGAEDKAEESWTQNLGTGVQLCREKERRLLQKATPA
jgi:hypothetical protein